MKNRLTNRSSCLQVLFNFVKLLVLIVEPEIIVAI